MNNPFLTPPLLPGHGSAHIALLPPRSPTTTTLAYRYPLKLLTRSSGSAIHLYALTYGGGLLPGDAIALEVRLAKGARAVVTTPQGSTKVFRGLVPQRKGCRGGGDGPEAVQSGVDISHQANAKNSLPGSRQTLDVRLHPGSALVYLPDPTAPFAASCYEQVQRVTFAGWDESTDGDTANESRGTQGGEKVNGTEQSPVSPPTAGLSASLLLLDWVTRGRAATTTVPTTAVRTEPAATSASDSTPPNPPSATTTTGEDWSFHAWSSCTELFTQPSTSARPRLLLRDAVRLQAPEPEPPSAINSEHTSPNRNSHQNQDHSPLSASLSIAARTHPHGVIGTLLISGPRFTLLADGILAEFAASRRVGGAAAAGPRWGWGSSSAGAAGPKPAGPGADTDTNPGTDSAERAGVLWTATRVRGGLVAVVKFGAADVDGAREWLGGLLRRHDPDGELEGRGTGEFGDGALGGFI